MKIRRILTLVMLPVVILGLYFVYQKTRTNEIYAVDPLIVTYNGDDPPDPMFELTDMKPGDTYERCFKVKNNSTEAFSVEMSGFITLEEKDFSHILEITIYDQATDEIIFQGLMKDLFTSFPFDLGNFPEDVERTYCISVDFLKDAGNEYQEAKAVFDLIWRTELPGDDIPPECEHLREKIVNVIHGTEGKDKIKGTTKSDLIFAYGGDDVIDASSDDDCVVLGSGNNTVYAEGGDDVIIGGTGNDTIYGGSGDDIIYAGGGNNKIYAGSGNDIIYGGPGDDYIEGGSGDDLIWGGAGNDTILGGSGKDTIYGEEGDDVIYGGSDDDYLDGGPGYDTIYGDSGFDICLNGPNFTSCEIIDP